MAVTFPENDTANRFCHPGECQHPQLLLNFGKGDCLVRSIETSYSEEGKENNVGADGRVRQECVEHSAPLGRKRFH